MGLQRTDVIIPGLLVSGIICLLTGAQWWGPPPSWWAWLLVVMGLACFIGLTVALIVLLRPESKESKEILYRRGEPRGEK